MLWRRPRPRFRSKDALISRSPICFVLSSSSDVSRRPSYEIFEARAIAHANIAADHSLETHEQNPCPNKGKLSPLSASCTRVPSSDGRGANTELLATTLGQSPAIITRPSYPAPSSISVPYTPALVFAGRCEDGECIAPFSAAVFVVAFVFAAVCRYAVLASKWIFVSVALPYPVPYADVCVALRPAASGTHESR